MFLNKFFYSFTKMGKVVIEYCGGWGFRGPANNLKQSIVQAYPNVEIESVSAGQKTSKIEVFWIDGGNKQAVWTNGRAQTDSNHQQIVDSLKQYCNWIAAKLWKRQRKKLVDEMKVVFKISGDYLRKHKKSFWSLSILYLKCLEF